MSLGEGDDVVGDAASTSLGLIEPVFDDPMDGVIGQGADLHEVGLGEERAVSGR